MRKEEEKIWTETMQSQLDAIIQEMDFASKKGLYSITIKEKMHPQVRKKLGKLGYDFYCNDNGSYEYESVTISWDRYYWW